MRVHPIASEFTELSLLKANVLQEDFPIVDGCVRVPEGPGLGVTVNEEVFAKYRKELQA
jgi:L-alanine-DL-glutamate epimerase-like enolase superfamily enzyme